MTSDTHPTVQTLKVLADETRLHVIQQLMLGPRRVYEINEGIGIDQSLLSHHLKVLRQANLVECRRDGKAMLYRLASEVRLDQSTGSLDLGSCQIRFGPDQDSEITEMHEVPEQAAEANRIA